MMDKMDENTKQKLIHKVLNMFHDFDEEDWKNVKFNFNSIKDVNNYDEYFTLTYNFMQVVIHYNYNLKELRSHFKIMNSVSNNIPALKRSYRVLKEIAIRPFHTDIDDENYFYFIELDKFTKDITNKANDVACKCMIYKKDDLAEERINRIVDSYYKSKKVEEDNNYDE